MPKRKDGSITEYKIYIFYAPVYIIMSTLLSTMIQLAVVSSGIKLAYSKIATEMVVGAQI